jgi:hypothetical protein
MRIPTPIQALSAAAAIALLAGCSGGSSAIAPMPASPQYDAHSSMGRVPAVMGLMGMLKVNADSGQHFKSYYSCPAKGPIKYVSDYNNSVIDVYVGKFAGQAPCGRITSGLGAPWGLYVKTDTHDLYVANDFGHDILVFHRGQTKAYNTYTDPTSQDPVDVTVAKDGTVIASNLVQTAFLENGSISTWIGGPNGGTFVGNFAMANGGEGEFVTVQKNGTVYYDDLVGRTNLGALWFVSCPAGACGAQTQVAGVSFNFPGGLAFDDTNDLLANNGFGQAETFELPNPNPKTFPVGGIPTGMAINDLDHHWFVADAANNDAAEYLYPSGALVGTVPGNPGGGTFGIAVDPGHAR